MNCILILMAQSLVNQTVECILVCLHPVKNVNYKTDHSLCYCYWQIMRLTFAISLPFSCSYLVAQYYYYIMQSYFHVNSYY